MLQPFFDFVDKFVTDFSWRRLVTFLSLLLIIGFVYFLYEAQTASSQLSKYERAVEILGSTQSLTVEDDSSRKVISNIREGLAELTSKDRAELGFGFSISRELQQAIAGAAIWIIIALFFVPLMVRNIRENAHSIVGGCLVMAFFLGVVGYFLPTSWSAWIVFGLYPVGANLILFLVLARIGNRKKKA